ncbi:MAG: 3'-5' exonuclease [Gammaproteobacteria bacterium]|nr:3'-5' exonuclease [Gammaproteobacteria bacterium]MBL7000831.1 3'-5' exonuclease [Gammaproteobacteria bacterium]
MNIQTNADSVIVLDFETTGLSPDNGDRAIEIGAVKLVQGEVVGRFQQLMYPGRRVDYFIESYTGISNEMLKDAPPCAEVMADFADFIQGCNLVAHNASFDARFLGAELQRIRRSLDEPFACSMLAARRLYPDAPNHKLGTLVSYKALPNDGTFHRALADAEMTAHLWLGMLADMREQYEFDQIPFELMQRLARTAKSAVPGLLVREAGKKGG